MKTTNSQTAETTTFALYAQTVDAILFKCWGTVRRNLDILSQRPDHVKPIIVGGRRVIDVAEFGCPEGFVELIQDRIDNANAKAFMNEWDQAAE